MKTDVVIIGAGPAGIFTALELIRKGSKKHITICEKGAAIENRRCPKSKTRQCVNCKPYCHITTGFPVRARSRTASCRCPARWAAIFPA